MPYLLSVLFFADDSFVYGEAVVYDWSHKLCELSKQRCYWLAYCTSRQKQAWFVEVTLF